MFNRNVIWTILKRAKAGDSGSIVWVCKVYTMLFKDNPNSRKSGFVQGMLHNIAHNYTLSPKQLDCILQMICDNSQVTADKMNEKITLGQISTEKMTTFLHLLGPLVEDEPIFFVRNRKQGVKAEEKNNLLDLLARAM
jgi:hypothetical protein